MINAINLGDRYTDKEHALNNLGRSYDPWKALQRIPSDILDAARVITVSEIDNRLRSGSSLSLIEALSGMLRVVAGTNNLMRELLYQNESSQICQAKAAFFLTRMAAKEQYEGLTPEEVAGITMGGLVDIVYTPNVPSLAETSGMGADRGWDAKRVKTINASTLSAIVLASLGHPTTKHGSYGNTTRVGSTDVPEQFGAKINQLSDREVLKVLGASNFWFNDAHAVKTIHYLSHLLMVETINHIVGPMTAPISEQTLLFKLMGVNHYVHPETVAKAYTILHKLGVIKLGGAVILSGMRTHPKHGQKLEDRAWFQQNAYLDEASVGLTLVSCAKGSEFLGTTLIDTKRQLNVSILEESIKVPNEIDTLMKADQLALKGKGSSAEYLALNSAFALAALHLENSDLVEQLSIGFDCALKSLKSGDAFSTLLKYIEATGGTFHSWE